jgi:hypothetical protein
VFFFLLFFVFLPPLTRRDYSTTESVPSNPSPSIPSPPAQDSGSDFDTSESSAGIVFDSSESSASEDTSFNVENINVQRSTAGAFLATSQFPVWAICVSSIAAAAVVAGVLMIAIQCALNKRAFVAQKSGYHELSDKVPVQKRAPILVGILLVILGLVAIAVALGVTYGAVTPTGLVAGSSVPVSNARLEVIPMDVWKVNPKTGKRERTLEQEQQYRLTYTDAHGKRKYFILNDVGRPISSLRRRNSTTGAHLPNLLTRFNATAFVDARGHVVLSNWTAVGKVIGQPTKPETVGPVPTTTKIPTTKATTATATATTTKTTIATTKASDTNAPTTTNTPISNQPQALVAPSPWANGVHTLKIYMVRISGSLQCGSDSAQQDCEEPWYVVLSVLLLLLLFSHNIHFNSHSAHDGGMAAVMREFVESPYNVPAFYRAASYGKLDIRVNPAEIEYVTIASLNPADPLGDIIVKVQAATGINAQQRW